MGLLLCHLHLDCNSLAICEAFVDDAVGRTASIAFNDVVQNRDADSGTNRRHIGQALEREVTRTTPMVAFSCWLAAQQYPGRPDDFDTYLLRRRWSMGGDLLGQRTGPDLAERGRDRSSK
jgi:hypothetical protein